MHVVVHLISDGSQSSLYVSWMDLLFVKEGFRPQVPDVDTAVVEEG